MRFLTRNLDACVTYKIIIPRCGDITLVKCENRFEIDSRNSGFPTFQSSILLPFFETSIRAELFPRFPSISNLNSFSSSRKSLDQLSTQTWSELPTQKRIRIDSKFRRIISAKLDRTTPICRQLWITLPQRYTRLQPVSGETRSEFRITVITSYMRC